MVNHAMLYIEDNESNISLVEALLKRRPSIELHIAMTGADGIKAALDKRPDLILLDNRLPDATGGEILRDLASAAATAAIPVVMLSGDSDEILDELLTSGAAESIAKPFDIHEFMAVIDRYLPDDGERGAADVSRRGRLRRYRGAASAPATVVAATSGAPRIAGRKHTCGPPAWHRPAVFAGADDGPHHHPPHASPRSRLLAMEFLPQILPGLVTAATRGGGRT